LHSAVSRFTRQYARKKPRGGEPNDRPYSRKTERVVRQMDPTELDRLLRDEGEPDRTD
jgi:hypothetical protein